MVNARRDYENVRWTAHDEQGTELWVSEGDSGMSGLTRSELEDMRGPTREETPEEAWASGYRSGFNACREVMDD
ncbi:hypothetical protein GS451_24085 [Rhodococcus hoagii]|nr:hypothetical protein [Prescottella equi]